MASVSLKNIKKIYPFSGEDIKRNKNKEKKLAKLKKKDPAAYQDYLAEQENKAKLQVTEQGVVAVQEFNLEIADREFVVLVGPSGCGKSTTLRMIAGLEEISDGELWVGDKLVNDVAPKDRDIAMVFQSYALYPHMTVYENMAFALKLRHTPKAEVDRRVKEAAELLDITQFLGRKPKALSGGQRQRVAIGRAIVRDPKVMLMDEPLSNLDAKLRNQMRAELIKMRERIDTTFVYVTHDQTEAMTLGDRIVIMKDGFIQQIGTPQQVFDHPYNLFVAGFIGSPQMNFFDAKLIKQGDRYAVELCGHVVEVSEDKQTALTANNVEEQEIVLGVRPEHMMLQEGGIASKIEVNELMGSSVHLHVDINGKDVIVIVSTMNMTGADVAALHAGAEIEIGFPNNVCHMFNKETGINLEA